MPTADSVYLCLGIDFLNPWPCVLVVAGPEGKRICIASYSLCPFKGLLTTWLCPSPLLVLARIYVCGEHRLLTGRLHDQVLNQWHVTVWTKIHPIASPVLYHRAIRLSLSIIGAYPDFPESWWPGLSSIHRSIYMEPLDRKILIINVYLQKSTWPSHGAVGGKITVMSLFSQRHPAVTGTQT